MATVIAKDHLGNKYTVDSSELIPRDSVYGIVIKDNTVLLSRETLTGQWEFPGGGVDEGEGKLQALQREIKEETGMIIGSEAELVHELRENFYIKEYNEAWDSKCFFYLVKTVEGGKLLENGNEDDVLGAAFYPIEEAEQIITRQKFKDVLIKAKEVLSKHQASSSV